LNLELLDDCEAVTRYLDQRRLNFPEPRKATFPFDPASHGRGGQRPTVAGSGVPRSGDPASHGRTDSKAFDSKTLDPKAGGFEKTPPRFFTKSSQADFEDLLKLADSDEDERFNWFCRRTGAPLDCRPATFIVEISDADQADLEKWEQAKTEANEEIEKHFGAMPDYGYTEKQEEEFFYVVCRRVGVTRERGLYLEQLNSFGPVTITPAFLEALDQETAVLRPDRRKEPEISHAGCERFGSATE